MAEPTITPRTAVGAVLNKWDAVAGAWVEIAQVGSIDWSGPSREVIEYFALNSPTSYINKAKGRMNAGQMTISLFYTSEVFIRMKTDLEDNSTIFDYQIVLPNGEGLEFSGFPVELPLSMTAEEVMSGDLMLEIDGEASFLSSASSSP